MTIERNLLFGVLAVQLKLASPQELLDAASLWAAGQDRDLGSLLTARKVITEHQRQLIASLIDEQASAYAGDAAKVLESLGGEGAVMASFGASVVFDSSKQSLSFTPLGGESLAARPPGALRVLQDSGEPEWLVTAQPGRYTMRGEKGRGGIGRVLIAFDEHIGREIALKELLPEGSDLPGGSPVRNSASMNSRFLREARITGQLEHPGIVPVYELGRQEDGRTYYTMKLVRGQTLADRLKACEGLSDRLGLLPHFLDLCQAIAYAHARGVIHRDIKPANVMVGEFGETVLLDWGLAKVHGHSDEGAEKLATQVQMLKDAEASSTIDGKPIGTPSYMPPEQADGRIEEIDERSDVWSLGAVLYELLTGRPPFLGTSAFDVIAMVLTEEVEPALSLCKDAPPELAAVAMRCLQRDPARRYQAVEQLAADAAAFQTGGLVGAYRYSTGKMLRRWLQKSWPVLTTAGVALLMLVTVAVIAYTQVIRRNLALEAANRALDQNKCELLAFKLATESSQAGSASRSELASLLAIEAARYSAQAKAWMPVVANALRSCAASPRYCRELPGHDSQVRRVAFSPDGKVLASCGSDRTLRLWDMTGAGLPPRILRGHEDAVACAAFSPDGKLLVSASHDYTLRIWDLATDSELRVLEGHSGPVWSVAFSPDGKWVASGGVDHSIRLWGLEQPGSAVRVVGQHDAPVQALVFSPDGKRLFSGGEDQAIRVWDLAVADAAPRVLRPPQGSVMWLAISPDGQTLVSASHFSLQLWALSDLAQAPRILSNPGGLVTTAAFSPDGDWLASGGDDNAIRVWNLRQLQAAPQEIAGLGTVIWSVCYSPDGSVLASSSADKAIRLWDLKAGALSPTVLAGHVDIVRCIAYSPSGKVLATGGKDKLIRFWDAANPENPPQLLAGHADLVSALSFSPDGKRLASSSWDKTLRLWDLAATPPTSTVLTGHTERVRWTSFSPDGRHLLSCGDDLTVRVWDPAAPQRGSRVLAAAAEPFLCLDFSPDGSRLAAGTAGKEIWTWGPGSPLSVKPVILNSPGPSTLAVRFSPRGDRLASGGIDQTVRLWDLARPGQAPQVLRGHIGAVYSLAFNPEGNLLASGSYDANACIWNIDLPESEPEVLTDSMGTIFGLAFSPDGRTLATASADSRVMLYEADPRDLTELLAQRPRRNLSLAEWNKYLGPSVPYRPTLTNLPPGLGAPGAPPLGEPGATQE